MIAIHPRENSFSEKWIEYCEINNIEYKLVNCFSSSIIAELKNCSFLLWHWHHYDYKATLMARQLTSSLELKQDFKIFPNIKTCWHFDDKIGQKYLLESINAPMVKSYVFYTKTEASIWIENTSFPKVFKLRGGAGAVNVKLINNKKEAKKYVKKSFSSGFSISRFENFKNRLGHFKRDYTLQSFFNLGKGLYRIVHPSKDLKNIKEKNYLYAQEFIPNNDCDIRVIIIGEKAFAIKRMVRADDFRASGSGIILYDIDEIPKECIEISFKVTEQLGTQCTAFDFVFDGENYLIIEISFGFSQRGYLNCPGYWDKKLNFIPTKFHPEYFIIENLLKS
jgi:hypothetical protein